MHHALGTELAPCSPAEPSSLFPLARLRKSQELISLVQGVFRGILAEGSQLSLLLKHLVPRSWLPTCFWDAWIWRASRRWDGARSPCGEVSELLQVNLSLGLHLPKLLTRKRGGRAYLMPRGGNGRGGERGWGANGSFLLPRHLRAPRFGSKSCLCQSGRLLIASALLGEDKAKGVLLPLLLCLIY